MKIPNSVKELYENSSDCYILLKSFIDDWYSGIQDPKWHYESRVKKLESFALKMETGRFDKKTILHDFFGAMVVVPSLIEIKEVESLFLEKFNLVQRKPNSNSFTSNSPEQFSFEDLRIYFSFKKTEFSSPKAELLDGLIFEIQIKTYLQHAWALSTHDLIYKSDNISWAKNRVAYQVKAMLESAELSISSAEMLSSSDIINKESKRFSDLSKIVKFLKKEWQNDALPSDLKRLSENILFFISLVNFKIGEMKTIVSKFKGNEIKNLTPFQSIMLSLIKEDIRRFEQDISPSQKLILSNEIEVQLRAEEFDRLKKVNWINFI